MSIKENLRSDLTEAIRGRDEITSSTIRMVLTAITNEEVAGKEARVLSDDEIAKQWEYKVTDPHTPKLSPLIVDEKSEDGDAK